MKKTIFSATFLIAILAAGCAGTPGIGQSPLTQGKVVNLSSGVVLPLGIQLLPNATTGQIKVNNPKTGEVFDGVYLSIKEVKTTSYTQESLLATNVVNAVSSSNVDQIKATLVGSLGTVLDIKINQQCDSSYQCLGIGEAEDNKGIKYSVQYSGQCYLG